MIRTSQWKDFNTPPNVPMITGKVSRKEKSSNTVVDTLATAAVAIIKELKKDATSSKRACTPGGMSPGKKVELSSQYLKQLKEIQNLRDEGVLTLEEFEGYYSSGSQRIQIKYTSILYSSHSYSIFYYVHVMYYAITIVSSVRYMYNYNTLLIDIS